MGPSRLSADDGITELYAAHWVPMVRLAWLLTGDQSVAEEIVQDALIRMHRRWELLAECGQVVAYLRTSVVNGSRSALRHRKVVEREVREQIESGRAAGANTSPSAEAHIVARAQQAELVQALRRLPQRQREVLTLRYFHDLSEAEIAQTLGISNGAVKAHAHRGLATLRIRTQGEDLR